MVGFNLKSILSFTAESPFSKSLKGKNLTGTVRHLRDLTADVHGIIQQWNDSTLEGINILKSIIQEKSNKNYTVRLQDYCDNLEKICHTLVYSV